MERIAIIYCKRIKDRSCIACSNCFKAIHDKSGEFARHDAVDLAAMTDCGDCPGLIIPRINLVTENARRLGRSIDTIYLGTCIKTAMETADCPLDFGELKLTLEKKCGLKVVLGTYSH